MPGTTHSYMHAIWRKGHYVCAHSWGSHFMTPTPCLSVCVREQASLWQSDHNSACWCVRGPRVASNPVSSGMWVVSYRAYLSWQAVHTLLDGCRSHVESWDTHLVVSVKGVCMYTCTHTHTHIEFTNIWIHIYRPYTHVLWRGCYTYTSTYAIRDTNVHTFTYMLSKIHIHVYIYIYIMCVCVCVHAWAGRSPAIRLQLCLRACSRASRHFKSCE